MTAGNCSEAPMNRIIRTEEDYKKALTELERLVDQDPDAESSAGEQLQLLKLLVQDYESKAFPQELPDPIDAIKFYMEQRDLTPRDLIPFMGDRSKVSQILSRKRALTLPMIRALQEGLGIPASVLIQEPKLSDEIDWGKFPLEEMVAREWLEVSRKELHSRAPEILKDFLAPLGSIQNLALLPRATHIRSGKEMDRYSLLAWAARIYRLASSNRPTKRYSPDLITEDFIRSVVKLSSCSDGPQQARQHLRSFGVSLVIEPHLPGTYLDAAVLSVTKQNPVIGLTLRYDRLDNFWFSLTHELVHLARHIKEGARAFFDDLDVSSQEDPREREADEIAGEILIPEELWLQSPAHLIPSPEAALDLAEQLGVHPAIVAGRMRHERKSFRLLGQMVGHGEVRKLFSETKR